MNKKELYNKILQLDGLTNEEKSELLGLLRKQKKYGLVWEDKPEDVEERLREELPVLVEDTSKALISTEADAPNHILIEGDNLEALTALAYTHEGKIDVIYIDPPYNTGNKDFVYNDSFVDREDGYRHSKWLSFMAKRLHIAKRLLSDKGVIFISIDDNEQAQLKLLCDEVFSYINFVGMISRATGTTTGQDTGSLGKSCDYILVYASKENYQIGGIPLSEKDLERYSLTDEKGNFSILQLRRTGGEDKREDRPTMFFPITAPDGTEVYPYGPTGYESRWRVGPEKVKEMRKQNLLYFKKDKNNDWKVYYKFYSDNKTKRPSNLWIDIDGNKKAQIELKEVLGEKMFDTPKPTQLVKKILEITNSFNSTILDFFAGSGTTLHATMELNKDGGKRQCILVTNNENNICEEVTYERNKRVINGYTTPKGEEVPGLKNNTLRYYRTGFVPREKTQKNMRALVVAATDMLCVKNNIYTETHEIGGAKMRPSLARHFKEGNKEMLVIYDDRAIPYIVDRLKTIDVKEPILMYVFSPNDYPYTDEFFEVADKVTLCALPAAIYDAYRKVLKKPKSHFLDSEEENTQIIKSENEDNLDDLFETLDEEGGEE